MRSTPAIRTPPGNNADHSLATVTQGNLIGGTTAGARNVFANSIAAIAMSGSGANGSYTIQGNYFGLNAAGTTAVLGTRATGHAIGLSNSNNNVIGGAVAGAGNVVANYTVGISIGGTASGNVLEGNLIGTNATGTTAVGNGVGVEIAANNPNRIGGTASGAGNLISGNALDGVRISGGGNLIQGNFIGVAADHTTPLPNLFDGVEISSGSNNIIGGTAAGAENTIAYNSGDGVYLSGPSGISSGAGAGNSVLRNSIYSNTGLGIDLNADGPNANDLNDPDVGPNNQQNFPVLSSIMVSAGATAIVGTLNSTPSSTFRVEFFSSAAADPSGFGEGQTYLGLTSVTTDAGGNASFNVNVPVAVPVGHVVTATATDAGGNTSEYSATIAPTVPPLVQQPPLINGGAAQRSNVSSIEVAFVAEVSFAGAVAEAFTLTRNGGGTVAFTATASVVGGVSVVTLSDFTGPETQFGSLRDGRYTLTALAAQISANGQQMASNYTFGDAQGLFRYYGDTNGDRRVDISDFGFFSLAYLQMANYNPALDFNNDGRIDISDFGQFSVRYFTSLP